MPHVYSAAEDTDGLVYLYESGAPIAEFLGTHAVAIERAEKCAKAMEILETLERTKQS